MLYAFCHEFISLAFEGDELYTIVGKRAAPSISEGWTAVIMERASRFIVDRRCGEKDANLFLSVMKSVAKFVRPHWTTGMVPAVMLGIMTEALRLEDVLNMRTAI